MKAAAIDRKQIIPTLLALILAALYAWVLAWRIPNFAGFLRTTKMMWLGGVWLVLVAFLFPRRAALLDRFQELRARRNEGIRLQRWWLVPLLALPLMVIFLYGSDYLDLAQVHKFRFENTSDAVLVLHDICTTGDERCEPISNYAEAQGITVQGRNTFLQPGETLSIEPVFFSPPNHALQVYFTCEGTAFTVSIEGSDPSPVTCEAGQHGFLLQPMRLSRTWLAVLLLNLVTLPLASLILAFLLLPLDLLAPPKPQALSFHRFLFLLVLAAFGIALAVELTNVPVHPPLSGLRDVFDWEGITLSFNSYLTYLFVGLVLLVYIIVKPAARWLVLLLASYVFLFSFDPAFPVLLLAITALSYRTARQMSASEDGEQKKKLFNRGAVGILAILLFFKYAPLLWSSAGVWFGAPDVWRRILLPAGLSFYSFTALSYLKDVQTGKAPAELHFGKFALYLAYFPKLLIGPIERPKAFLAQLEQAQPFDEDRFVLALSRIGLGLFKRLLVSNRLAVIADAAFTNPHSFSSPELMIGLLAFTFQVYIDFSAYTDIAIGISSLFGIQLTENFQQPYFAVSVVDFWRRWHISFSSWLRDYVFLPLEFETRRIRTKAMQYVNTLLTFLISGMWHGATLNFLVWGGMHGVLQIGEDMLSGKQEEKSTTNAVTQLSKTLLTFGLVALAWVWFRADTFQLALDYFAGMFNIHTLFRFSTQAFLIDAPDFWLLMGLLPVMLLVDLIQRKHDLLAEIYAQPLLLRWAIYLFAIFAMIIFGYYGSYEVDFVYMQF